MTDSVPPDLSKLVALAWGQLMIRKRHESAAMVALVGHFFAREWPDRQPEVDLRALLFKAIEEWHEASNEQTPSAEKGKIECSFCLRGEPDVRLAAGARAFICDSCVATFNEAFDIKRGD